MSQTVRPAAPVKNRKSKLPWFVWLGLVLLTVGWWLLYQSKYFLVESVTIVGNSRLTAEQITGAAAVPVGNALMSLNTGAITEQLLTLPEIKIATVERGWPHTILITVTERTPIAVAQTATGFNLIDDEGKNAGVVGAPPAGLLVIAAEPDSPAMKSAIAILAAVPAEWKLASLTAATQDSVIGVLGNGVAITFGSGERAKDKVDVASALMEKGYTVINVSAPDAPTIR
jgi:cell division protein FtsQ